jgi:hypothetical protein
MTTSWVRCFCLAWSSSVSAALANRKPPMKMAVCTQWVSTRSWTVARERQIHERAIHCLPTKSWWVVSCVVHRGNVGCHQNLEAYAKEHRAPIFQINSDPSHLSRNYHPSFSLLLYFTITFQTKTDSPILLLTFQAVLLSIETLLLRQ